VAFITRQYTHLVVVFTAVLVVVQGLSGEPEDSRRHNLLLERVGELKVLEQLRMQLSQLLGVTILQAKHRLQKLLIRSRTRFSRYRRRQISTKPGGNDVHGTTCRVQHTVHQRGH